MTEKIAKVEPVKKVEVSAEWADAEKLQVAGLIATDMAEAHSAQDRSELLFTIQMLINGRPAGLEDNRALFAKWIS